MKNLVISVPRLEIHRPPISTAIVCSVIKNAGANVQALDLNCEFYHFLANREQYYRYDDIWDGNKEITLSELKNIIRFIKLDALPKIKNYDRLWISVFGQSAHLFSLILMKMIRKTYPTKTIIIGGQGLSITFNSKIKFGQYCKENNLCDIFLVGEGEIIIQKVLNNDLEYPGINNFEYIQIDNLDILPYPDYSFYNLDRYDYLENKKEVFIVGSRGCVRRCTYCDVASFWPKFRYRSGKNIADEMINHYEKHGVTKFYFTDSLINGSLKAFIDMCENLAKYNNQHKSGFEWGGQFIFRPKHQLPKDHFATIKEAGGNEFYVGVETGSDKIRWEMDKKFTNNDIDFQLEEMNKNNLFVYFLMVIGYVTETEKDHHDTLQMFKRWQKYVATGTIRGIDLGFGLTFLDNTPLMKQLTEHQIYFLRKNNIPDRRLWMSKNNPNLTIVERTKRRLETHKEAIKYNWPIWRGSQRLESTLNLLNQYQSHLEGDSKDIKITQNIGTFWIE